MDVNLKDLSDAELIERLQDLSWKKREIWSEIETRSMSQPLGSNLTNEAMVALRGYELREVREVEEIPHIERSRRQPSKKVDPLEKALEALKRAGIEL